MEEGQNTGVVREIGPEKLSVSKSGERMSTRTEENRRELPDII
jgi:hypothetical protein